MFLDFRPRLRWVTLALLITLVPTIDAGAKPARRAASASLADNPDRSQAAADLAEQVGEISRSSAISRAKKEKRISTAVRVAVVAATAYKKSADEILGTALELTGAAAAAAPQFAEVIANAASFAPALTRIDSAASQVRSAAFAAAKAPKATRRSKVAAARSRPRPVAEPEAEEMPPSRSVRRQAAPEETAPEENVRDTMADSQSTSEPTFKPRLSLGDNTAVSVTADLSIRHDDNVYLSSTDKVGDSIIAVTPGVEFRFGQNSLAHGSLNYRNAFTRYVDKTSPNVSLGSGGADFGFNTGTVAVAANGSFQQLNQNNSEVSTLGQKAIFRKDVLTLDAGVESHVTAKTSIKTGANYSKSDYKTPGLTGSQETEIPLKVYYETTPKVSLSAGASYRRVNPQNGGATGKDLDYDVGARGNFTAKLSGELSLDYRTRAVGNNPKESLWGFNGTLNYELTPKTTSALVFSRDFSTGALGESLKNSSYSLHLSTEPTPQWQIGGRVSFRQVEYGPAVFSLGNLPALVNRNDDFWQGDLQATYLFRSWFTVTADLSLRNNHSTLPGAQFSNSILSLILGWRY